MSDAHSLDTLRDHLRTHADSEAVAELAERFLIDAALCGPIVPVRPLLARYDLDEDTQESLEDLLEDQLVEGLELFEDFEYGHPGFPQGVLAVGESTYVYGFRDADLPNTVLTQLDAASSGDEGLDGRAAMLYADLETRLPLRTETIGGVYRHLSQYLPEPSRTRATEALDTWAYLLATPSRDEIVARLRDKDTDPDLLWRALEASHDQSPQRQLMLAELYTDHYGEETSDERRLFLHLLQGRLLEAQGQLSARTDGRWGALEHLRGAHGLLKKFGKTVDAAGILGWVANIHRQQEDHDAALARSLEALAAYRAEGHGQGVVQTLLFRTMVFQETARPEEAQQALEECAQILQDNEIPVPEEILLKLKELTQQL